MKQEYQYTVVELVPKESSILKQQDRDLIRSYTVGTVSSFNPDESRLDVEIYDTDDSLLESYQDTFDYTIRGVEQGATRVNQLEVDPTIYMKDRTFLGDIVVEYKAYDNAYSRNAELYITEISSDRTELRARSLTISVQDLRYYTNLLQGKLNSDQYFAGAFLNIDSLYVPITNIITEVVDGETVVTLKLYSSLPANIPVKSRFQVLESLGESTRYRVSRKTVVVEEELPALKGPNFNIDLKANTIATDYKNYTELLSQKSWESSKELYSSFREAIDHVSVNYEDFSDFVHFSSAFERLENARYKFEKIFDYQISLEESQSLGKEDDVKKLQGLIGGVIGNFDHYENYLWFESGSAAWPKKLDPETGTTARPFVNVDHYQDYGDEVGYGEWYDDLVEKAEAYDNTNKDILISTIPIGIREDLDNNEPYLVFIHMIGQHFDDLWIYAKAITERYSGDNRLNFGISKELVKDALEAFGVELYETNQNLSALFELCNPDGTYGWGEELPGTQFIRASEDPSWIEQPTLRENYTKQVYKRIYHNIPALLKMKGTSRGLRVLLNCFGIPNDILTFRVQGGTDTENRPFFGPEETVNVIDEGIDSGSGLIESPANSKKVRTNNKNTPITEYRVVDGTGSFYSSSVLSRYTTVTSSKSTLTDDTHKVEVGFDLNEAVNNFFKENVGDFTVDDLIGDPRNVEEHYGDLWKGLRESLLSDIPTGERFRAPAAIIRLVRYFDSTFFRMLKNFIPARASIDSGAIVKDNILHRNRWKGVSVSWTEHVWSGSISGSEAYGSHGGSFECAGERFDTSTGSNIVSTGDRWVDKPVASGSREFNGELAGTVLKATDGDLSKYNTHRKDLQPDNNFRYSLWFLDLPDPPLCRSKLSNEYRCDYWEFEATPVSTSISSGSLITSLEPDTVYRAYLGLSENQAVEVAPVSGTTFMGWYPEEVPESYGNPMTVARRLPLDPFRGSVYSWKACYSTASAQKMFWMEQVRPDPDYQHYYSPENDIILAWKLLDKSKNPKTDSTEPTGSVLSNLGGLEVQFLISSSEAGHEGEQVYSTLSVRIPEDVYFGTNNAYYWAQGLTASGSVVRYGITDMGGNTGPFYSNPTTVVDTVWFDNYEDWHPGNWFWPITVGEETITPQS